MKERLQMKVLIADPIADAGVEILRKYAEVDIQKALPPEQLQAIIGDYEALIVRSQTKVTADIIDAGTKLQVIGRAGVGIDNIDVEAATRRGILVVNSPEGNIVSTAEHTIAMLLSLARRIPKADSLLHANVWNRQLKGTEIRNKTLGIIGLGRVGTEVAQLAQGLRMSVIAYDPLISESRADRLGLQLVELETLLATSDFITIHVPMNSSTRGLISARQLKLMKPTALLVNCARGGIVDEEALYKALEQGLLAGAAIDVFSQEPAQDNILFKSDKVIVTPHLAASTSEAEISAARDIAEQVADVISGRPAKFTVNAPMIPVEAMPVLGPYMEIGTKLSRIAIQLISGHPESLTIHYQGDISKEETNPIKVAVLSSMLGKMVDERVTVVNADRIASERGITVTEQKDATCENYANMLAVEIHTTSGSTLVAGSSLRGRAYLTRLDAYWLEVETSTDYMLFAEHKDRPGVIGAVGTITGEAGVNISQMHTSVSTQDSTKAMMVLSLDGPLPEDSYQQILAIPNMRKVVIVKTN